MEAYDRILKTLLEMDDHQGTFFGLKYTLEKYHPDLAQEEISRILERLEAKGLISTPARKMRGAQLLVKVNPSAYTYYQNREELLAAAATEKSEAAAEALAEIEDWEERQWNLKMISIGFIAGLIAGIALMWVKYTFFH